MSGFVSGESNQPPRECGHCVWYKADHCHHPVVQLDPEVPGEDGKPKPVRDEDCCNFYKSPGKTLLYCLRHGTTELNEENKFRGFLDVPLDDKGRADAKEAAEFLQDKGIVAIYSSDLERAMETAQIVGEALGIEPCSDYRLRPWDVGDLAGTDRDENQDVLEDHIDNPDDPLPGGESLNDFGDRTQEAIEHYLCEARTGGITLLVFHTSNETQLQNYCEGEGAAGRPESKDSVLPGGIIQVTEKKDKLTCEVVFKENGSAEYGS